MYIDAKRILLGVLILGLGLGMWQLVETNNNSIEEAVFEMETGTKRWSPDFGKDKSMAVKACFELCKQQLAAEQFNQAAITLYHNYSEYQNFVNVHGEQTLESGQQVKEWFDKENADLTQHIQNAYTTMLSLLEKGDFAPRNARDFFNHMPFPLINELKRQYQEIDKRLVESKRVENAENWILVSAYGNMGNSADFEEPVRKELLKKWNPDLPYKLVFGGSMSRNEESKAAAIVKIHLEAEGGTYGFEERHDNRGSAKFLESVTMTFDIKSAKNSSFISNWHQMKSIGATFKAPESIAFEFENDRQVADFSDVIEKQRQNLISEFEKALSKELPSIQIEG